MRLVWQFFVAKIDQIGKAAAFPAHQKWSVPVLKRRSMERSRGTCHQPTVAPCGRLPFSFACFKDLVNWCGNPLKIVCRPADIDGMRTPASAKSKLLDRVFTRSSFEKVFGIDDRQLHSVSKASSRVILPGRGLRLDSGLAWSISNLRGSGQDVAYKTG